MGDWGDDSDFYQPNHLIILAGLAKLFKNTNFEESAYKYIQKECVKYIYEDLIDDSRY